MKIGKKYYILNNETGHIQLIKTNNLTEKKSRSNFTGGNTSYIPKKNKNQKKPNNELINNRNLSNDEKISINKTYEEKIKINDNKNEINNLISLNKTENNILNNYKTKSKEYFSYDKNEALKNNAIRINNTDNLLINNNKSRELSLKINNNSNNNGLFTRKLKIKFYKRNKELEDNIAIQNKIFSKRNLKKLIEKRQKSHFENKINTTNSNTNYSNNNTNINKSLINNNINNSFNNNKQIINNLDKKIDNKKLTIYDIGELDLVRQLFPNYKSLKIKNDDSWYLKTIKNQLFKDKIYNKLKKQYQFYEDLNNKKEELKIPKINIKKTILLNKREIFPAKQLLAHKLYFDYIKKQKQKDNDSCEIQH